jgi:hypothetical protein
MADASLLRYLGAMGTAPQPWGLIGYRVIGFLMAWAIPMGLVCALVAIVIHILSRDAGTDDKLYEAGQLMLLNVNPVDHKGGAYLWVARLFAMLAVLLFGIEVVLQFGGRGIDRIRLWYRTHIAHRLPDRRVLVIGSDDLASRFARSVLGANRSGRSPTRLVTHLVLGPERTRHPADLSNPVLTIVRPNLTPACLSRIGVDRYTDVVIIESSDSVALETLASVLEAVKQGPRPEGEAVPTMPTIRVRIQSPELCATLRRSNWVEDGALGHVRMWCPDDLSARRVLRNVELDGTWSFAKPGGSSTMLMLGFGAANRALAARAIGQMHHVDETPVRLHVFDEHADRCWSLFHEAWPGVEGAVEHALHGCDAHGAQTRAELRKWAGDNATNLLVAVSIGDLDANLALASSIIHDLSASTEHPRAVILIRQRGIADADEIARFARVGGRSPGIQVLAWGDVPGSQSPGDVLEEELDELARSVHAEYLKGAEAKLTPEEWLKKRKEASATWHSPLRDWELLWPFYRDDNRNSADFAGRRLAALGLALVDATGEAPKQSTVQPVDLTRDELTILAKLEHRRWTVNRLMNGWRRGEEKQKDPVKRIHHDLVPWEQLSEESKGKDFRVTAGIDGAGQIGTKQGFQLESMQQLVGAGKVLVRRARH